MDSSWVAAYQRPPSFSWNKPRPSLSVMTPRYSTCRRAGPAGSGLAAVKVMVSSPGPAVVAPALTRRPLRSNHALATVMLVALRVTVEVARRMASSRSRTPVKPGCAGSTLRRTL
jgi:hypothetical protein